MEVLEHSHGKNLDLMKVEAVEAEEFSEGYSLDEIKNFRVNLTNLATLSLAFLGSISSAITQRK